MSGEHKRYGRKEKFFLIGLLVVLVILSGTWQPRINIELVKGKEQIARIEIKELEVRSFGLQYYPVWTKSRMV